MPVSPWSALRGVHRISVKGYPGGAASRWNQKVLQRVDFELPQVWVLIGKGPGTRGWWGSNG